MICRYTTIEQLARETADRAPCPRSLATNKPWPTRSLPRPNRTGYRGSDLRNCRASASPRSPPCSKRDMEPSRTVRLEAYRQQAPTWLAREAQRRE